MVKLSSRGSTIYISSRHHDGIKALRNICGMLIDLKFSYKFSEESPNFYDRLKLSPLVKEKSPLYIEVTRKSGKVRISYFKTVHEYITGVAAFMMLGLHELVMNFKIPIPIDLHMKTVHKMMGNSKLVEDIPNGIFDLKKIE